MKVDMFVQIDGFRGGYYKGNGKARIRLSYTNAKKETFTRDLVVEEQGTQNSIAIHALIAGMQKLIKPCDVEIRMDNEYVRSAIEKKWLYSWAKNGFRKARGESLKNEKEWRQLYMLSGMHKITFSSLPESVGSAEKRYREKPAVPNAHWGYHDYGVRQNAAM